MPGLKQTQDHLMQFLLNPQGKARKAAKALVAKQGEVSADTRLDIYANAYRIRLTEVIENDHEQLGFYLGDELFERLATDFIAAHPSHHRSLRHFCDPLPAFLASDSYFSQYPIVAELARFERLLLVAFDAADAARADFSELTQLAAELWPQVRLRLHPSVQLFHCHSNAVETWQALRHGTEVPAADYSAGRDWLIWRGHSRLTEFISLAPWQTDLLQAVLSGEDFAALCEAMLAYVDEQQAPVQVLESLKAWFDMGLISRLDY
ncbi:HvfC/BufC family peptide modification chaperone [Shewanella sp. GXUN23E]|uniref:HvfC/BufC family peptide modification chaperone n=1 Tax=Shewanella sp. GXUN23E TaxID=3422498 RepID=UPI003D7DB27A